LHLPVDSAVRVNALLKERKGLKNLRIKTIMTNFAALLQVYDGCIKAVKRASLMHREV